MGHGSWYGGIQRLMGFCWELRLLLLSGNVFLVQYGVASR